ncbi:MAG TPA: peptide-N4-asparagine amidase [Pseudonocardiaceae bacterium]|nr:peptide-N4-asparagine amidase [Pseudonocardiaceae bacterium]
MRPIRSVIAVACAALLSAGVGTALAVPASGATPAIEINSQNPVTAPPAVSRPHTHSCTVPLATNFPSNNATGGAQNFTGTIAAPTGCAGPWAKIVLDWTTSVSGRQFDRSGSLNIGPAQIYFGTTYEPDPAGITYHFAKDITEYKSLFATPQPFDGGIVNFLNTQDTGNYVQTVTVTFYQADRHNPAPAEPDVVAGLGGNDASPGSATVHLSAANLPRNITRALLEVSIKGNGCDEQWFTDVPDDVSSQFPAAGLCGHGPYREIDAAIDGTPAGVTQFFPYIYTGGIVPTLWRPIPAVGTFDMTPELIDVTPFVGQLVDGRSHDVALTVANIGDTWNLAANLLLWTDHGAKTTSGALTSDTVAPAATQTEANKPGADGAVTTTVTAARDWSTSGFVNTSAGRIRTTVTQHVAFRNADTVTAGGFAQALTESDNGTNTSLSTGPHGLVLSTVHTFAYPITIQATFQITDDNNFDLSATVDMSRRLFDLQSTGREHSVRQSSDEVNSFGLDQRANGVTVAADGHSTENFAGDDDTGHFFEHFLASASGLITVDRSHRF